MGADEGIVFVVNPAGGGGRALAAWDALRAKVLTPLPRNWRVRPTRGPGDGEVLARSAVVDGTGRGPATLVVACGGDGTINEVVNGLFVPGGSKTRSRNAHPGADPRMPALGIVPLGTGSDFIRSLGWDEGPGRRDCAESALARLGCVAEAHRSAKGTTLPRKAGCRKLDVGRVTYTRLNGKGSETRLFLNMASVGLSGECLAEKEAGWLPGFIPGALAYQVYALVGILKHRNRALRYRLDGAQKWTEAPAATLAVVANGQYFGGGMRIAPRARCDNGKLSLSLLRGFGAPSFVNPVNQRRLYAGDFSALRSNIDEVPTLRTLEIEHTPDDLKAEPGRPDPFWWKIVGPSRRQDPHTFTVEVDGEVVGRLPARFEVLPSAIDFRG